MFTKIKTRIQNRTEEDVNLVNYCVGLGLGITMTTLGFKYYLHDKAVHELTQTYIPNHIVDAMENGKTSILFGVNDGPDLILSMVPPTK